MSDIKIYSKSNPNLISKKTVKSFDSMLKKIIIKNKTPTLSDYLTQFYNYCIKPNLFPFIIITLFALYLYIRYYMKKNKKTKRKSKKRRKTKSKSNKNDDSDYIIDLDDNTNPTVNIFDPIVNNTLDLVYENDENNDNPFIKLAEEYNEVLDELKSNRENSEFVSEEMIYDIYNNKRNKEAFNQLANMLLN